MRRHDSPVGLPDSLANHDPALVADADPGYHTVVGDEGQVEVAERSTTSSPPTVRRERVAIWVDEREGTPEGAVEGLLRDGHTIRSQIRA